MSHRYEDGPTTCVAHPKVIRDVRRQIKASNALSRGDIRLATAMRLVNADTARPLGFNDAVFYPPREVGSAPPGSFGMAGAPAAPAAKAAPADRVSRAKTTGTLHALALLVDFSDNKGVRPAADFQRLLFDPANPNSMTSIYKDLSYGQLNVTGEAVGYVRAPKPYSFYTDGQSGMGDAYPKNTPGLLFDALTEFCKNDSLGRFDTDGDGYVDGIFLIHAGGGAEAEPDAAKRPGMIWSHKWTLPAAFVNNGVSVYAYSTEPEDGRVGVFAHEFGHVLGLPDLYDTTYRSAGVGAWCLMAAGSWGGGGDKPARMCCWCLAELGWVKPKAVKKAGALVLKPLADDAGSCYRLWTGGKSGSEYFLIENRQKAGRDASLPVGGLALWHIDETRTGNTNPAAYQVGLVQADGQRDLELDANQGDAGDLFPGSSGVTSCTDSTTPSTRSYTGAATKVAVTGVSLSGTDVKLRVKV